MKKNSTHENFEHFLKENADELRMRPPDAVWRTIEGRLNRRRRWVFFSSAFFLITASLFGYLIIDHSKQLTDPFAAVQTIQKKDNLSVPATSKAKLITGTSPRAIQTRTVQQNQSGTNRLTQLFQNPIALQTVPDASAALANVVSVFTPIPVDEQQPFTGTAPAKAAQKQPAATNPLTIESVVNSYKPKRGRKSEFQLFFTPTVSYRRLTENKAYLRAVPQNLATYNIAALYDVNSMVTHKPDMGLELGFAYKFPVSNHVKLRTGMQFNITRYDIRAFTYVPERTMIALNTRTRGVDSLATMSSYRNFSGGQANWLQNFYFQVSAPVGVEVTSKPAKKTRFGVAATIQPTYVLGDRAYLISSDYKNYSQVPWLIRHWNVNTSLETFVSYSTGTLRWQVGPQVRYQLLSSFVEKYPVKENLFDFGMKVGVSLNKK